MSFVSHVVRRSMEQFPSNAGFGEDSNSVVTFKNGEEVKGHIPISAIISAIPILIITIIICASIDYTIGSLMASLAMIESPTTTTILDPNPAPPAYTDEPDAPINKNQSNIDGIPVMTLQSVPITGQATYKFLDHLKNVGGFFARWRGFGQYLVYHIALNVLGHGIGNIFRLFMGRAGEILGMVIATILTVRLHMLWTHAMIGSKSSVPWYRRFVPRKQCKVLLLPILTYAVALQLVVFVPLGLAALLGLTNIKNPQELGQITNREIRAIEIFTTIMKLLSVPATAMLIALTVVLPAAATLVRVEACLLPEEQETIVSFDKETIMGDVDINERGSSKKIFAAAWRSFSRAARWRVVKVLLKSFLYQIVVGLLGFSIALTVFWMIARKDIKNMINSMSSQFNN